MTVGTWWVGGGAFAPGVFMSHPKARAVAATPGRAGAELSTLGASTIDDSTVGVQSGA